MARQSSRLDVRLDALVWLVVLLLTQAGLDRWNQTNSVRTIDYFTLWAVPHALHTLPDAEIYDRASQTAMAAAVRREIADGLGSPAQRQVMSIYDELSGGHLDVTGSPLVYALIGLISTGHYDRDAAIFVAASFVAFSISIVVLCRLLHFSLGGTALAFTAYSLCFSPLLSDIRIANVNEIQLLLLTGVIWLSARGWPAWAGACLGLSIVFKPNTAMVLAVLVTMALLDRRITGLIRLLAGAVIGAVAAIGVGALYFGSWTIWGRFAGSLVRTLDTPYPVDFGNFSPAAVVTGLSGAHMSLVLGVVALGVLIALLRSPARPEAPAADESFLIVGIGCVVMLLTSHLVWLHYYVLLIPLQLYLLRPGQTTSTAAPQRFGVVASGLAMLLFSPAAEGLTSSAWQVALMTNTATLLLFTAGLHTWRALRQGDVDPTAPAAVRGAPASPVEPESARARDRGRHRKQRVFVDWVGWQELALPP